ncbi:MAG: amino acid ABC transporter permease [Rhodospirillales bacterium]|jgi:general L-amino acid transport system permease protein|nr:amino acid ABC transporter permease [Rhodospirillales bacterium]
MPTVRWYNNRRVRGVLYQIIVLGGVVALAAYLVDNTLHNLERRSIATGFDFLGREAGFGISETLIDYSPADTYFHALLVGLFNTLKVSIIGIVLATVLGTIAGIARLSRNWLVAQFATFYVETLRNIPVLLQLFFWYALITEALPVPREALNPLPGVFLSARGMRFPEPVWGATHVAMLVALIVGIVAAVILARWARRRQERTGQIFPTGASATALILGLPAIAYIAGGAPTALDMPELRGFNFTGGVVVTPEFAALLIGLVLYTGTFIAEIVRGGILAVSHGQTEAGLALGLSRGLVTRLIVLPQALRVIIPPLTSQYLNLTKNSSLAVAIGFPDLVSVANTAINQTGQAVEGVAIIMAVYLTISLSISAFMNWYNQRIALKGGR